MEIEVKYKTDENQAEELFSHPLIAPFLGPRRRIPMAAIYYDTARGGCAAAGFALRLRREGAARICAAKGGAMEQGVARRTELEVEAANLEQGIRALLAHPGLPEAWRAPLREGMEERARMEFDRVAADYERQGVRVELCYDTGFIAAGGKRAPIGECELELKQGSEQAFLGLARQVQQALGWQPWIRSKYDRAKELMECREGETP